MQYGWAGKQTTTTKKKTPQRPSPFELAARFVCWQLRHVQELLLTLMKLRLALLTLD